MKFMPVLALGFFMHKDNFIKKRSRMLENAKSGITHNSLLSCFVASGLKLDKLKQRSISYQMIEKALLLYKSNT